MSETWKRHKEIPLYEVSDLGRVKNSRTGRILKTHINKKGYECVTLSDEGVHRNRKIHSMVMQTFDDTYEAKRAAGLDITHSDGNRTKNNYSNLEWKSRKDILNDTYKNGRKQTHKMKRIRCVETGVIYDSIKQCCEATGLSKYSVGKSVNRRTMHTSNGLHFEEVE